MEAGRKSRLEQVDCYKVGNEIERMDLEEKGEMERTTVSLAASPAGSLNSECPVLFLLNFSFSFFVNRALYSICSQITHSNNV